MLDKCRAREQDKRNVLFNGSSNTRKRYYESLSRGNIYFQEEAFIGAAVRIVGLSKNISDTCYQLLSTTIYKLQYDMFFVSYLEGACCPSYSAVMHRSC
jgi:hypothetical protein